MKCIFASLFLIASYHLSHGQDIPSAIYEVDTLRQVHDLNGHTFIVEDSAKIFTIEEMIEGRRNDQFIPLSEFKGAKKSGGCWLRIHLNPSATLHNWWLIVGFQHPGGKGYYSGWEVMETYITDSTHIISRQLSGLNTPRSLRKITEPAGLIAASISLPSHQVTTIYIRLENVFSEAIPAEIFTELRNPSIEVPHGGSILYALSAISGILSILSFFFYLFVRDKAYLFFFIYLLFLSLHYLILHPHAPFIDLFIPEHSYVAVYFFMVFAFGGFIMLMMFGRHFMNLPALSPRTDQWLKRFLFTFMLVFIAEIALMMIFGRDVLKGAIILFIFIFLGFLVRFAFFKNILARFFVAGAVWLIFFTILGLAYNSGLIDPGFNPWPIGQVGEMLIYMAGLAYKIRLHERAHAEAMRIQDMDKIKSRFFANISHEFRTPLTLIRGIAKQISDQALTSSSNGNVNVPVKQITTIDRNADRLLELVNQLLDLSRLDSGKVKLQIIRGDVLQVLKMLSHSFDSMAERKQIHYRIHFPEATPIVFFDQDKLEKIYTNLLSNAFKYTPEKGTVSIEVSMDEERLRITVEDSGAGIPKKELDKVFDRFYQVEGTEDKGSGIGLALVKELVELYRGQISVSSEPAKGTQFRVSLPIAKQSFEEGEIVYGEWKHMQGETIVIDNGTEEIRSAILRPDLPILLVVEDNTDLRQFIREAMQVSYNILEAENGMEGFDIAIEEIPDLIISDVMMPKMNGFDLTTKLKKNDRTSHIPVILLTAKAGQPHKIEGLETGADEYVTKPFDVKELLVRAQNLVEGRKRLRQKFAEAITIKPSDVMASSLDQLFLKKVMDEIEKQMHNENFGVEELAHAVAMSRSQLHRKLIAILDKPPSELLRQTRLLRAKELLQKKSTTPAEVAFHVGFNSHSYFSKCFKEEFGVSPGEV